MTWPTTKRERLVAADNSGQPPGPVGAEPGLRPWARSLRSDRILRSAGFLTASQAGVAVFGFVFWLVSARLANANAVGEATTLVATSQFITYLTQFGINSMFLRFLPTSTDPDTELSTGFITCFVGTVVISTSYVEMLPLIAPRLGFVESSPLYTLAFVAFTSFGALNLLTDSVLMARQRALYIFWADGVVQGATKVLMSFVLVTAGVYVASGAFGIFSSFGTGVVVDVLLSLVLITGRLGYRLKLRFRLHALTRAARYTATNYAVTLLDVIPTMLLPTVVLDGLGGRQAAYFYMALQVSLTLSGVGVSIALAAISEGAQGHARLEEVARRSRRALLLAIPPIFVVGLAVAPFVLAVFGPSYQDHATRTLVVLMFSIPAVALCHWSRALLQITKQLSALLVSQSLYCAVIIGLSVAMVHHGTTYVAGAYVVGNVVAGTVAGTAFLRRGAAHRSPALASAGTTP